MDSWPATADDCATAGSSGGVPGLIQITAGGLACGKTGAAWTTWDVFSSVKSASCQSAGSLERTGYDEHGHWSSTATWTVSPGWIGSAMQRSARVAAPDRLRRSGVPAACRHG